MFWRGGSNATVTQTWTITQTWTVAQTWTVTQTWTIQMTWTIQLGNSKIEGLNSTLIYNAFILEYIVLWIVMLFIFVKNIFDA